MHDSLHGRGLRILAFPCNSFGKQEPGDSEQIRKFVDSYHVRFDVFAKVEVNGKRAHPVFQYLRSHLSDVLGSSIKWNFTKFLTDRDGIPAKRFSPATTPLAMLPAIEELLERSGKEVL